MSRLARFRSAITGRFVMRGTAQRHPRETVTESNHEFDLPRGGYFLHGDVVAFTAAIMAEQVAPVPLTTGFDAYLERRLSQWERGTWPR